MRLGKYLRPRGDTSKPNSEPFLPKSLYLDFQGQQISIYYFLDRKLGIISEWVSSGAVDKPHNPKCLSSLASGSGAPCIDPPRKLVL